MTIKLYKMSFSQAHFGEGHLNESHAFFDAGRLFSALFLEALKLGDADAFLKEANHADFRLSDAFPYLNGTPYLPKPIGYPKYVENEGNLRAVRRLAKQVKKIKYIPWDKMSDFLNQSADVEYIASTLAQLEVRDSVTKKGEDPYDVGLTTYKDSLYIMASESKLFDKLMESLQYSGLGGKRSSGYGQFSLEKKSLPLEFVNRLQPDAGKVSLSLTTSLPTDEELHNCLENAYYMIKKTSGFAFSESANEQLRKQDLYKFIAGSTFEKTYKGKIWDVKPNDFSHPVWNYSKGFFYAIDI